MITANMVWVEAHVRGPHGRRAHHVSGFVRRRPACRQKTRDVASPTDGASPSDIPFPESVAPCDRGPQQYTGHGVHGYWRRRPRRSRTVIGDV